MRGCAKLGPLRAVHGVSSVALNLTEAATCRISLPRSERVPGPDEKGKGTAEEKRPGGFGTRVRLLSWAGHLADGIHAHARSLKGKGAVRLRKEPEGQRRAVTAELSCEAVPSSEPLRGGPFYRQKPGAALSADGRNRDNGRWAGQRPRADAHESLLLTARHANHLDKSFRHGENPARELFDTALWAQTFSVVQKDVGDAVIRRWCNTMSGHGRKTMKFDSDACCYKDVVRGISELLF